MHSDGKKRRSFLALLFAAGDLRRSAVKFRKVNSLFFWGEGGGVSVAKEFFTSSSSFAKINHEKGGF